MNVALVYDRVNKWGGAERVLLALHKIWPKAPLFTAVYDTKGAVWANVFEVHPSFLQRIPLAALAHESLPILTPIAFESFSFDGYDVVISVTSAEAKNIITKPNVIHICYCLTPTRYLWSSFEQYKNQPGLGGWSKLATWGLTTFAPILRAWDRVAASRPDYYIAISERVKSRIETYYKRTVTSVIYPPVDTKKFKRQGGAKATSPQGEYFLTVSRLVSYKRLDIIIQAFNQLRLPLVIIGDGRQKRELKNMAGPTIRFIDHHLTDSDLVRYYEGCRAFVFAGDEDFGLAALEAQSMGVPIVAFAKSGIAEIVKEQVTGILFDRQDKESLMNGIREFLRRDFSRQACRKRAEEMSEERFIKTMKHTVLELTNKIT